MQAREGFEVWGAILRPQVRDCLEQLANFDEGR